MVFAEIPDERSELNQIFEQLTDLQNQINNQQQVSDLSIGSGRTDVESFGTLNTGLKQLFVLEPLNQVLTKVLSPAGEIPAAHTNAIVSHASDDPLNLYFLENPAHDGQIKFLHPEDGKSLVLKTGGHFANGSDITVQDGFFTIMLWSTENGNKWLPLQTGAGGGINNVVEDTTPQLGGDLDYQTFDGINIDRLIFDQAAGNALVLTTTGITSNAAGDFNTNVPTGGEYDSHIANILKMRLSQATSVTTLDVTGVLGAQINVSETTAGKVGSILQGSSAMQYTTTGTLHEFLVGVASILTIDAGGLVMNQDIDYATFDGINIDRLRFTSSSAAPTAASDPSIFLDGSDNMVFNLADQKQWFWTNNSETIMQLDRDGANNDTVLTIETDSTDASAIPRIDLFRDDPSPANDDTIALIRFIGDESAGGSNVYGQIEVEYESVTAGREAASMIFAVSFDTGATTQFLPFMAINTANDKRIRMVEDVEIVKDLILQSGDGTSQLFFDGGGDTYFTGSATSGRVNFYSDTENVMAFANDALVLFLDTNFEINAGYMHLGEIGDPSAGTNSGKFYVKDVGGVSRPFFIGDGLAATDLTTGGGGSQTPWLSAIDADNFGLTDVASIVPDTDGTRHLGGASNAWDDIFTDEVRFTQSGVVGNKNSILADSGGMNYLSLNTGSHDFYMNGNARIRLAEDGEIEWLQSGRTHSIVPEATALKLQTQNQSDDIIIFHGSKSNETWNFGDLITTYKTSTTELNPLNFQFYQNHDTPAAQRTIVRIEGYAENSASVDTLYARIEYSTADSITSGSENGRIQMEVRSNGAFVPGYEITGDGSGLKMGWFGVSEVVQQNPAVTAAAIHAALQAYGLFV